MRFTCLAFLIYFSLSFALSPLAYGKEEVPALGSLQCYTGLFNMPTARVLGDWRVIINYGNDDPYSYYGVALGLFDRVEFHGQFTEINTIEAFPGQGYGHYKDRSAGVRVVLLKEREWLPQIALGVFDVTGTALFGQRYIVASKLIHNVDFTFGLGQGILAGEFVPDIIGNKRDRAFAYLLSSPHQRTRPFGGVQWFLSPKLVLVGEYSSINYKNMFGFVHNGQVVKRDDSKIPFNFGLKYKIFPYLDAKLAWMRGARIAFGMNLNFPLDPQGFLGWKKESPYIPYERTKWRAYEATNDGLASLVAREVKDDGFKDVRVACSDDSIWVEVANNKYLSSIRAIRRVCEIVDGICPPRIQTFYINLKVDSQVLQSLKCSRADLRAFIASRIDKRTFLSYNSLTLYGDKHLKEFLSQKDVSSFHRERDKWFYLKIEPKVRTFLNNRRGFFKNKVLIQTSLNLYPWEGMLFRTQIEHTLYNQFKDVAFYPLEKEPTRTDIVLYERNSAPRLSQLALDQVIPLPGDILFRASMGFFESAYAGLGLEAFRFFNSGLWGLGLESEIVKKRDPDNNFRMESHSPTFYTAFLNCYANVWPSKGVEVGLKVGRFLAGDKGVRFEIRRSFKYFTIGGWFTKTDTSIFSSEKNRDASYKGIYIKVPFAVFKDKEVRGRFNYAITSFTRDQGQTVDQIRSLYPMDPWNSPYYTKEELEELRK